MDTNKKVLVVEDDDLLRKIIIDQLVGKYQLLPARDGEEALSQIAEKRPDLIVLDLLLPKLDGFAVLERLRAMPDQQLARTPVIVVSNLSGRENMERANQYHIEEFFAKTDVNFGILNNRINRIFTHGPSIKW